MLRDRSIAWCEAGLIRAQSGARYVSVTCHRFFPQQRSLPRPRTRDGHRNPGNLLLAGNHFHIARERNATPVFEISRVKADLFRNARNEKQKVHRKCDRIYGLSLSRPANDYEGQTSGWIDKKKKGFRLYCPDVLDNPGFNQRCPGPIWNFPGRALRGPRGATAVPHALYQKTGPIFLQLHHQFRLVLTKCKLKSTEKLLRGVGQFSSTRNMKRFA